MLVAERFRSIGDAWRELEGQGYRIIRLNKSETDGNSPELYAPIVMHNLRSMGKREEAYRFMTALELRKQGRSPDEIKRALRSERYLPAEA